MDRSPKHQPSKAFDSFAKNPLDSKVLREQSRSHLAKKNQQEQTAQMGYGVPYGMAVNPYLMVNPMAIPPWTMGYPSATLPGGTDMANPQSDLSSEQPFVAQSASIQVSQPPANVFQPQYNVYASLPMPVYGYPHQIPLVPLQPVQVPQNGFYPMYAQQAYQPQFVASDTANAVSMIASTIKRKFFGLTYPPLGNATPKPKMLSVETWRKIREAQKTLRHNWQSEMRLKEKPSDRERRHSGDTLDDLFPNGPTSSQNETADKATRYVQVDLLQAPNPISVQADFAYDYSQDVHVPVSNDISCVINAEAPIDSQSGVGQSVVQEEAMFEATEAIQADDQVVVAPIAADSDIAAAESVAVETEQLSSEAAALSEPLVVASIEENDVAQEVATPVATFETDIEKGQFIESVTQGIAIPTSDVEVKQGALRPKQDHVEEGLDELFTEANDRDLTAGWKPYSSKPSKSAKTLRQNVPISISRLKQDGNSNSEPEAAGTTIWSKVAKAVQRCLAPSDNAVQKTEQQVSQTPQTPLVPLRDDYARLRETMASLQQDAQEEGVNTYAMWRQYKQVEGKMRLQKKVIHDLLSVQESFDDSKLDYCYLPEFADNEAFVSELDEDMAKDLGLGTFDEIQASVDSRHPSLRATSPAPDIVADKTPKEAEPPVTARHVDVEVLASDPSRHRGQMQGVYKDRVLDSIKGTPASQGIDTLLQQSRQTVDMRKASLDAAVKEALVYTPTNQEVIAAAMNRHMIGMQGMQPQAYRPVSQDHMPQEGIYSMETTVRVEFKQPGRDPVSMMHRIQEDFTVQSMLQSNRMLSNSISSLADEYFKHAAEEDV